MDTQVEGETLSKRGKKINLGAIEFGFSRNFADRSRFIVHHVLADAMV